MGTRCELRVLRCRMRCATARRTAFRLTAHKLCKQPFPPRPRCFSLLSSPSLPLKCDIAFRIYSSGSGTTALVPKTFHRHAAMYDERAPAPSHATGDQRMANYLPPGLNDVDRNHAACTPATYPAATTRPRKTRVRSLRAYMARRVCQRYPQLSGDAFLLCRHQPDAAALFCNRLPRGWLILYATVCLLA